jgi:hypothetical protein
MLNDFLSKLPSTNYRIAVTVFLAVVTTARYVGWGIPGDNDSGWYAWLAFLGTMAGVDAWQFKKKRETEDPQMIVAHARARAIRESGAVRAIPEATVSRLPDYDREGDPVPSPRPVLTDHDRGVI